MFRAGYKELIEKFDVTFPPEDRESFTYDEVYEMLPDYDVLQSMFNFPVDRKLMERGLPRLQLVSNYAVGFDNIDIPVATELGITVTNTPDPVTEPTADLAMGLILAVARRIADVDKRLRIPGALTWGLLENLGYSLYGKTLGIIGMGRIGQALARRAIASGMKIIYFNRHQLDSRIEALYNAKYVTLDELFTTADVVSVNAPHTAMELAGEWSHPYSRQEAAFPLAWVAEGKFFPYVTKIDNGYGDRNLVCRCMDWK